METTQPHTDGSIFEKRIGLKKYSIEITPEDREKIEIWKMEIGNIKNLLKKMLDDEHSEMEEQLKNSIRKINIETIKERLLSREMTEDDLTLFALAIWIRSNHGKYKGNLSTLKKLLSGGTHSVEEIFEKDGQPNCYETSAFAKFIAEQSNIPSTIKGITKMFPVAHQFTVADIPYGPVIDPWFDQQDGPGFFPTTESHNARIKKVAIHQCSDPEKD